MTWLLVDLAIILTLAICIFFGYRRGLIGVAFKIVSFFLAIIIAFILYKPVSNIIINHTNIDDSIQAMVVEKVQAQSSSETEVKENGTSVGSYIEESLKNATVETVNGAIVDVATQITTAIINIIIFVIVYVIARLILLFAKGMLDIIAGLPIIKQTNKVGRSNIRSSSGSCNSIYSICNNFFGICIKCIRTCKSN